MPDFDDTPFGRRDPWTLASEGLSQLRTAMLVSIVSSIALRLIGLGLLGAFIQLAVTVVVAGMTVSALAKWRHIPPESNGKTAATMAWVGANIGLGASLLTVVLTLVALSGHGSDSFQTFMILIAIVALLGSLLQIVGFLLSARAVATYLRQPDLATRTIIIMVLGIVVAALAVAFTYGVVGHLSSGIAAMAIVLLVLVIVALVLFLALLSGLQRAIAERPSLADAFA